MGGPMLEPTIRFGREDRVGQGPGGHSCGDTHALYLAVAPGLIRIATDQGPPLAFRTLNRVGFGSGNTIS